MKKTSNFVFIIIAFLLVNYSCENNNTNNIINNISDSVPTKSVETYEKAKLIFYSLPSPVETAMLIETAEIEFNKDVLNPTSKVSSYVTTTEQAFNLGVYSADLSYISLFNQQETIISYLAVSKKLTEELKIFDVINDSIIQVIKDNVHDKNKILNVISETFMTSSAYLEENDRGETAALIVSGGWIEGLYLSVSLVGESVDDNPNLVEIIFEQQLSLEDLIGLLEIYSENKDIELLLIQLKELKVIYQKLQEPIEQNKFNILSDKVKEIRMGFCKIKQI